MDFSPVCQEKGGNDEFQANRAIAAAWLHACARITGADQAHRNARRRHDLKLLSLRGETTPRTPVWRSKRGSQLDRWKGSGDPEGRRANRSLSAPKSDV